MRIIRIAHRDNFDQGMYADSVIMWECSELPRHPAPSFDSRLKGWFKQYFTRKFRFGFKDRAQAAAWLYDESWREHLRDHGYVVYEMEMYVTINGLGVGDTQVIFDPETIRTTTVHDIVEYLK